LAQRLQEVFINAWDGKRDESYDDKLFKVINKVAVEAKKLRDYGYDGPFMGKEIVPLFTAINEWEKITHPSAPYKKA
ncbi:MAG: hypothetical protein AABY22_25175, partial [Nanoarchaeota archaeon]